MKYASAFAGLAAACGLGAWQATNFAASLAFAWGALACLILTLAYATRCSRLLGKRPDGTLVPLQVLAAAPYHALNALTYTLACIGTYEHAADEIVPGLWLSRRLSPRDSALIERIGALAVLDAAAEMPETPDLRAPNVTYLSLPLLDTRAPTVQQMNLAASWITEHIARGPVIVHCALGHGRSATLVAAYLLRSEHATTVEGALEIIRSARPRIELSREQTEALQVLANQPTIFW